MSLSATEVSPLSNRSAQAASPDGDAKKSRRSNRPAHLTGRAIPILSVLSALALWEFAPRLLTVESFIFPPLSEVVGKLTDSTTLTLLYAHAQVTIYEAMVGLAIGVFLGVSVGFVLAEWSIAKAALYPFIVSFQSMPKVALAPLFIIWFGFGYTPKILVVVMLVFFPMLVNTMNGILATDPARLDLFRSLSASRWQIWRRLLLPSALPSMFAGLEVAVVNSFIGAITGEFVGADAGLGVLLQQFKNAYDTAGVFAILVILALVGVLLNQTVRLSRRRLVFWQ